MPKTTPAMASKKAPHTVPDAPPQTVLQKALAGLPALSLAAALAFGLSGLGLSGAAHALSLGVDEFAASKNIACVLAQDTLGYLSAEEYADLAEDILDGYNEQERDTIYAKALGYYDGLMFGLQPSDQRMVSERLREFVESRACTVVTGYKDASLML